MTVIVNGGPVPRLLLDSMSCKRTGISRPRDRELLTQEQTYFSGQVDLKGLIVHKVAMVDIAQLNDATVLHVSSKVFDSVTLKRVSEVLPSLHNSCAKICVGASRNERRPVDCEKCQRWRRDPSVVGVGFTSRAHDRAERIRRVRQGKRILRPRIGGELIATLVVIGRVKVDQPIDAVRVECGESRHLASRNR